MPFMESLATCDDTVGQSLIWAQHKAQIHLALQALIREARLAIFSSAGYFFKKAGSEASHVIAYTAI